MNLAGKDSSNLWRKVNLFFKLDEAIIDLIFQLAKHKKYKNAIQFVLFKGYNCGLLLGNKRVTSMQDKNFYSDLLAEDLNNIDTNVSTARVGRFDDNKENHLVKMFDKEFKINQVKTFECVEFELFCYKSERVLVLDNELADPKKLVNYLHDNKGLFKVYIYVMKDIGIIDFLPIGSFNNNSLRKSHILIDIIAVAELKSISNSDLVSGFEKIVMKAFKNCQLIKILNTEKCYEYPQILVKIIYTNECSVNLYFYENQENHHVSSLIQYRKWITSVDFDLETIIAIKLIKMWR